MGTFTKSERIIATHRLIDERIICLSSPVSGIYKVTEFAQMEDETLVTFKRFTDLLIASEHYDVIVEGNIK